MATREPFGLGLLEKAGKRKRQRKTKGGKRRKGHKREGEWQRRVLEH